MAQRSAFSSIILDALKMQGTARGKCFSRFRLRPGESGVLPGPTDENAQKDPIKPESPFLFITGAGIFYFKVWFWIGFGRFSAGQKIRL